MWDSSYIKYYKANLHLYFIQEQNIACLSGGRSRLHVNMASSLNVVWQEACINFHTADFHICICTITGACVPSPWSVQIVYSRDRYGLAKPPNEQWYICQLRGFLGNVAGRACKFSHTDFQFICTSQELCSKPLSVQIVYSRDRYGLAKPPNEQWSLCQLRSPISI